VTPTFRQPRPSATTARARFSGALVLLVAAALLGSGCSSRKERDMRSGAELVYSAARKSMDSGNYGNAIRYLELLEARFPFSNQSKQAQLDLIYAYYKDGQREAAVDAATQFERENPTHPRVDYALYMRGRAYFSGQRSWYHRLFRVDLNARPPKDVDLALSAFGQLLQRFPDSIYAPDARQRMVFLRNRLAYYELNVARYYESRGAWIAALNRAQFVMSQYDGSPAVGEALALSVKAYEELGMRDLAEDMRAVLAANYPDVPVEPQPGKRAWFRLW
jgi:outer membrane protein assembly factor BamD